MTGMAYRLAPTVIVRSFEYETVLLDRNTLRMYSLSRPAFRQLEELLRLGAADERRAVTSYGRDSDDVRHFASTLLSMGILVDGRTCADPATPERTPGRPLHRRRVHGGRRS